MYLLGAGGHAATLVDSLGPDSIDAVVLLSAHDVASYGFQQEDGIDLRNGVAVITENELLEQGPTGVTLVNGIGQLNREGPRTHAFERFRERGFPFARVVHDRAIVSTRAQLAMGVQILAGAVVGPGAKIGNNTIVNTRAVIEHGTSVGEHCHVAPGAIVCGDVSIDSNTVVGAGATIIQGRTVGSQVLVGAGSVVVSDIASGLSASGRGVVARTNRESSQ